MCKYHVVLDLFKPAAKYVCYIVELKPLSHNKGEL